MRYGILLLVVGLVAFSLVYAEVPQLINFQGRLTDASGKYVSDGNYSLTFRLYSDSTGGSAKWSETQSVAVSKGLFNVILGSVNPIPDSIFSYSNTWLGIKVSSDPEMSPRQRLSSSGYSYRGAKADTASYSTDSDKLDGLHATDFTSPISDYGRSGVATDLYEGTTTLTDKYVNEGQANAVNSSMINDSAIVDADISNTANIAPSKISGTAWTADNDGPGSGLDADLLDGQQASAFVSISSDYGRSGVSVDLYEGTTTLTDKYVNEGQAGSVNSSMITDSAIVDADLSNTANIAPSKISGTAWTANNDGPGSGLDADLLDGQQASAFVSISSDYGRSGVSVDLYEGITSLTDKYVSEGQVGSVNSSMIIDSVIMDADISDIANISASKINDGPGSGLDADLLDGQHASTFVNSSLDYGRSGVATDLYEGTTILTDKYVNEGQANSVNSGMITDGAIVDADLSNTANIAPSKISGTAWTANNDGPGSGLDADLLDGQQASAFTTPSSDYGRSGVATNLYEGTSTLTSKYVNTAGPDSVYTTSGTAFKGRVAGSSTSLMRSIQGYADNTSTGSAYGGYFSTSTSGTGFHYGVMGEAFGSSPNSSIGSYGSASNTSTGTAYGTYGYATNSSSGNVYGGSFTASSPGTGNHYGIEALSYGNSSNPTYGSYSFASNTSPGEVYGSYGFAQNTSTGNTYGGYFETSSGSGAHYGVRASGNGSSDVATYGFSGYASNTSTGSAYGGYFYADSSGTGTKYGVYASASPSQGYAGFFTGKVRITDSLVVLGSKSAAVKVDNGEYRLLYSQESPENWFEDFGEGQLINGRAHIELDPLFLQTVTINSLHPMKVFIQLRDDCKGTYVKTSDTGFDAFELQGGTSNASFSYRIVAKRKGYEDLRLAKMGEPTPEKVAAEQAKVQAEFDKERTKMKQERREKPQIKPENIENKAGD